MSLQGKACLLLDFCDKLSGFQGLIDHWLRKVSAKNLSIFPRLSICLTDNEIVFKEEFCTQITSHLKTMKDEFERYFPDISKLEFDIVRNPFSINLYETNPIPDDMNQAQEELIVLINDSNAKEIFKNSSLSKFCCQMIENYQEISHFALQVILPFPATYLYETAFSSLIIIKSKY